MDSLGGQTISYLTSIPVAYTRTLLCPLYLFVEQSMKKGEDFQKHLVIHLFV